MLDNEARKANREALKNIIKLTTRAKNIDREVSSAKIKLEKLQKEQDEIYAKLAVFSDPNKPDTTDTLEDEPTESYEAPVTHTLAV
jgi:hypothetical protein